jgi:hypothetical protein
MVGADYYQCDLLIMGNDLIHEMLGESIRILGKVPESYAIRPFDSFSTVTAPATE